PSGLLARTLLRSESGGLSHDDVTKHEIFGVFRNRRARFDECVVAASARREPVRELIEPATPFTRPGEGKPGGRARPPRAGTLRSFSGCRGGGGGGLPVVVRRRVGAGRGGHGIALREQEPRG